MEMMTYYRQCCLHLTAGLLLVLLCCRAVGVVAAGKSNAGPDWGMQAGAYGRTHLPGGHFTYALRPGAHLADSVVLINFGRKARQLRLYAADMLFLKDGGFAPAQAYRHMTQVGAWVHLSRRHVVVPPHDKVRVPFTVQVPAGTPPSNYQGAVVAAAAADHVAKGMAVETRIALIVHLSVPGLVRLHVGLGRLQAEGGNEERFRLPIRSRSNVTFTVAGVVEVRDGRKAVAHLSLSPANIYVVPGGSTDLQAVWHGPPLVGRRSASATVRVKVNDKPYRTYRSGTIELTFFPTIRVGAGLTALLILLTAGYLSKQRWMAWLERRREERAVIAAYRAGKAGNSGAAAEDRRAGSAR